MTTTKEKDAATLEAGDLAASLAPIARLLLTPNEAAASLRISARKLWSLTKAQEIPCVRLGKTVRYSPAELTRWIEQKTQGVAR